MAPKASLTSAMNVPTAVTFVTMRRNAASVKWLTLLTAYALRTPELLDGEVFLPQVGLQS